MNNLEIVVIALMVLLAFAVFKTARQESVDSQQGEEFRYLSVRDVMKFDDAELDDVHHDQ